MAPAFATTTILVIDDNPIDRDLFKRMLNSSPGRPFRCIEGEHGRGGLAQYQQFRPDCVLLDLNLPDIDGLEVLRQILQESDPCPVIVTTAYGSEGIAVDAMKKGATDYLVKGSMTGEALAHTIENALEKRALQRRIEQQRSAIEERNRQLEEALAGERSARSAVERSENRYRTLAEALPQVVWSAAHPSGDLDYVNQRWFRLTGTPGGSALGRGWLTFIDEDDRAPVAEAWRLSLQSGAPLELECRIRAADQSPRRQLMRALPLMQDGHPVKWMGTFTDVEDQKRAEHLVYQRQKLESIGILAGGVAHDFNNLLVGIIGGVSWALEALPSRHELRPILEGAFKAGERAAHLTRQMLAYAGKGGFLVESVDVSQVLQTTCHLIQASIPKSVEVKLLTRQDLPRIRTDASQLQQIIMNLMINAAEAIPTDRQGFIIVRTDLQRVDAPRSTWSADLTPGDYVILEVRDNGSGMEPAVAHKIFDPFFTTKFTGRGLGLAAVHGILRSNKGAIEVESSPGAGSTFTVFLPVETKPAAPIIGQSESAAATPAKGKILVVDDEPIVCRTAKAALERAGHAVDVAAGGKEAIDLLSASKGRFSLILLDLSMPGMDGEQTFEAIRREYPDMPVVICSGHSDRDVRTRFAGRTTSGFLQKPFDSEAIRNKVAELLQVR